MAFDPVPDQARRSARFAGSVKRADHEDRRREIDQAEVPEGVEVVRVVSRQRHGERQHGSGHRSHPRPKLPPADPEDHEEQHREARRGDEPRQRDMQMADLLVERWAELLDGVLAQLTCFGPIRTGGCPTLGLGLYPIPRLY